MTASKKINKSQKAIEIQEKKALNRALKKLEIRDGTAKPLTRAEAAAFDACTESGIHALLGKQVTTKIEVKGYEQQIVDMKELEKTFLQKAEALIKGDRQKDYGDKLANFAHIAMFFQAVLAPKLQEGVHISPEEVGMMMQGVKMARMIKSPDHSDSVLDNAGYAGCIGELQAERLALKKPMGAITDSNSWMIPNVGS